MEYETDNRLDTLEKEIRSLRLEVKELQSKIGIHKSTPIVEVPKPSIPITKKEEEPVIFAPLVEETTTNPPLHRSFEETIMWALPKVFMVILVLGVLWGLKLISDYGFLSDSVKLLLAYTLSIGLIILAYYLETKKGGAQAITISLYGGAFIIGILTTAAGAILYEVLPLYVALAIALLYIAYGIFISYHKKNEVLTIFVTFTSLLLPYLLEYMDFQRTIILVFILLLFISLQPVILKHLQRIALYISFFFSIVAIQIISAFSDNADLLFAFGLILLLTMFIYSWWRLYEASTTLKHLHEGLLFSASTLSILFINFVTIEETWALSILALLFTVGAFIAFRRTLPQVVDVLGTLSLLTFLNVVMTLNLGEEATIILYPLSAFIGLIIALRLRASLMKVTYSFVFTLTVLIFYFANGVKPFWDIENLNHILILAYMIILYIYAKRPKDTLNNFEKLLEQIHILNFVPILISAYFFAYVLKLDWAFFSEPREIPYALMLILALVMILSFITPERFIGPFLSIALLFGFLCESLSLLFVHYTFNGNEWINLVTRLIYSAVIIALIVDLFKEGLVYKKWEKKIKQAADSLMTGGIVLLMLLLMVTLSQMEFFGFLEGKFVIASHTILLFTTASIGLWLSKIRKLRIMRLMGFGVLGIGIIKLVFFDLSNLDLLVRAVLFMTIGGIGLFLSNRLLKKDE